ncbi:MAG TPA: FtsQ-type POTRA domain-containing protein [Bacillota bacterium]
MEKSTRRRWRAQRRVFLIFDLLLIGGIGLFFFLSSSYFRVATVSVTGNVKLSSQEVINAAQLPPKANLWQVKLAEVRQRLAAEPWIKEVAVRREFPGRLIIDIKECEALAAVPNNNTFYLVDADGRVLRLVENLYGLGLPVLTGVKAEEWRVGLSVDETLLNGALAVIDTFDPDHRSLLAEVHAAPRADGSAEVTVYTTDRITVLFGAVPAAPDERLKRKIQALVGIVDDARASKLRVRLIDLRYDGPPVIRLGDS